MNAITLPNNPNDLPVERIVDACRQVYDHRDEIIASATIESAAEALRRAKAIETYVSARESKDEARRAARILETAVGEALGPAVNGGDRRSNQFDRDQSEKLIRPDDASRFRLMAEHRDVWWPLLEENAMSRRDVLKHIAEHLRPPSTGAGEASITQADAIEWLAEAPLADLLFTDPPYSTDVDDIGTFVASWLPAALARVKTSGRAFVWVGAYADELAAYLSHPLPSGWRWGVPHAWAYRNTIGPTPEFDFVRNWQCMLTLIGPDAGPLHTDRITDLLAGYVENAPDGRHEVKHHRWQKPQHVAERLVSLATNPNAIVIDPFSGSGTHLLACLETGRRGFGCDNDPEAVNTCIARGCRETL